MPQVNPPRTATTEQFITHELNLGSRLNRAIHNQQRADFSYLLAMLSPEPLEQAAELLERPEPAQTPWVAPFPYAKARPLKIEPDDYQRTPTATWQQSRILWRLLDAVHPEGLNVRDDVKALAVDVYNNCPPYVRQRLQKNSSANEWQGEPADLLEVIEQIQGAGH